MFRALARNQHRQVVKHSLDSSILPSNEVFREFVTTARYRRFPWLHFGTFRGLQGQITLRTFTSNQNYATELTFPQYFCDQEVFPDLLSAFSNAGCVTRLEAIFDDFIENAVRAFVETLQQYISTTSTLQELVLTYFGGIDAPNITAVLQSLHASPSITKLSLYGGWTLDPINEDTSRETLNESVTNLSFGSGQKISHHLFFFSQVECFSLVDWEESPDEVETLFQYLQRLALEQNHLKQLSITNSTLPEGFLPKLVDILQDNQTSLDSLSLGLRGRIFEFSENEDSSYGEEYDDDDDDSEEEQVGNNVDIVSIRNECLPEKDVLNFFGCLSTIRLKHLIFY